MLASYPLLLITALGREGTVRNAMVLPPPPPPPPPPPLTFVVDPSVSGVQPAGQAISVPYANIFHGQYRYLADLMQLETACPPVLDLRWPRYHTPIRVDRLLPFLASHPDQAFAAYIYHGLTSGFRIGFSRSATQLQSRSSNHPSALANGNVVQERITAELEAGRLYGPIPNHMVPLVHISPMGLVPNQTNKWRLIVDLSCPSGSRALTMELVRVCVHCATILFS